MKIEILNSVAKAQLTNEKHPFLYFELYDDHYGIELFYGFNFEHLENAPWKGRHFDIKEYPINEETVNRILVEYRRFILPRLMEVL